MSEPRVIPEDDRLANNAKALGNIGVHPWESYPGMTLRHLLAGMAMQGLLANSEFEMNHVPKQTAAEAVECADALLKELAK